MENKLKKCQLKIEDLEERLVFLCNYFYNVHLDKDAIVPSLNESSGYLKKYIEQYLNDHPKSSKLQLSKKLGITQGRLYEYLGGKRLLPQSIVSQLSLIFNLSESEKNNLLRVIQSDRDNRKRMKQIFVEYAKKIDHNRDKVDIHHVNTQGMFAIKSHFHYLVLTGLGMNGVPGNIDSISSHTGLRKSLVEEILEDLLSGNLVTKEGSCYQRNNECTFVIPKTEEEINHCRAIAFDQVDYSLKLLRNDPTVKNSTQNGFYFAGNSNKFDTAKKMLDEALLKVAAYMDDEGKNDAVYSLSMQCAKVQS